MRLDSTLLIAVDRKRGDKLSRFSDGSCCRCGIVFPVNHLTRFASLRATSRTSKMAV
jgi:hypothetical protein